MKYKNQFKRMTIIISIITLILIIGLTSGGRERVTKVENLLGNIFIPIQNTFNAMAGFTESIFNPIFQIWENERLVNELELENQALKESLVDATLEVNEYSELMMLRKVFNFLDQEYKQNLVEAKVVSKDPGNWYNMFTIDQGINNGILKNSVVINGDGLIGLAYEVGDDWSKVLSIIDNKSSIGFKILHTDRDFEGILNGGINGNLSGVLFDPKAEVYEGDLLVTSGKGLYPEGIIIGRVNNIRMDEDILLINIDIEPLVNFKQLNRVLVIPARVFDGVGE